VPGRIAEGLAVIEAGFDKSEAGWLAPELLRLRGELLPSQGAPAAAEAAERLFPAGLLMRRAPAGFVLGTAHGDEPCRLLRNQGVKPRPSPSSGRSTTASRGIWHR